MSSNRGPSHIDSSSSKSSFMLSLSSLLFSSSLLLSQLLLSVISCFVLFLTSQMNLPWGSLSELYKTKKLGMEDKLRIALGIATGLGYLHQAQPSKPSVIHNDIRGANIKVVSRNNFVYS